MQPQAQQYDKAQQAQQFDTAQVEEFKRLLSSVESLAAQGSDDALRDCRALLNQAAALSVPDSIKQQELARVSPAVQSLYIISNENAKQEAYVHTFIEPNMAQAAAEAAAIRQQTPEQAQMVAKQINTAKFHRKRHCDHMSKFDLKHMSAEELEKFIEDHDEIFKKDMEAQQKLLEEIPNMSAEQLAANKKEILEKQKELEKIYQQKLKELKETAKKDPDPKKRAAAKKAIEQFRTDYRTIQDFGKKIDKAIRHQEEGLANGTIVIETQEGIEGEIGLLNRLENAQQNPNSPVATYGQEIQDEQNAIYYQQNIQGNNH